MQSITSKKKLFHFTRNTEEWMVFSIRMVCIFLFIFSGYEKIVTHDQFLKGLQKVAIVGDYALAISWLVPILELLIGVLLLLNKTAKLGLYIFTTLMIIFTLYIGSVILWAEKVPCHCNLIVKNLSWPQHILFNLVFIVFGFFALHLIKKERQLN